MNFLEGVGGITLSLLGLWMLLSTTFLLYRTIRGTARTVRAWELKDGWSKWHWAYIYPLGTMRVFFSRLKEELIS